MNFKLHSIKSKTQGSLETELVYEVASARASGIEILKIDISEPDAERFAGYAEKKLRSFKKNARIQFFIPVRDIEGESTEAEYLKNKYPEIVEISKEPGFSYVIKI